MEDKTKGMSPESSPRNRNSFNRLPQELLHSYHFHWTRDLYKTLLKDNIDAYKHEKDPLQRPEGFWVEYDQILAMFNNFNVFYNLSHYEKH